MRKPGRSVLAVFRPTWRQAIGRGLYAAGVIAAVTFLMALALPAAYRLVVVLVPTVVAAAGGALLTRRARVVADEHGLRAGGVVSWKRVVGIQAERRRRRTVVVVSLDPAGTVPLPAPYDGVWLAHDPLFERRLFMLRHLWETHRDWSVRG
ncbi:hypothetical protein WEI85_10075 [Actinomycetes bacterium KLBMP 9797]